MRELIDLRDTKDPAWPLVQEWLRSATNPAEVLPPTDPQRAEALVQLQVTTGSPMGAVVYETGGILVDHGWLRLLGSGHPRLPRSLPEWTRGRTWTDPRQPPPLLLVADDVIGGFFALNGGALPGAPGSTFYFVPDILRWEDLRFGYTAFLQWAWAGDLAQFYATHRWSGWQAEVRQIHGGQALSIYPFLWAQGPPIGERSRGPVPIEEVYGLQPDLARRLRGD
jgi:Protein of unknown function DUF2625